MTEPVSFTAATGRHALPMLFAGQAQKEFFVNESLSRLDLLLHPFAEAVAEAPPDSPAVGQCWLVGTSPSGAFVGHARALAGWDGTQWTFVGPREGMVVRLRGDGCRVFDETDWRRLAAPPAPAGGTVIDQPARDALATLIAALTDYGIFSS